MIYGMPTNTVLPEGWMAIEAVAVIKCLDVEGDARLLVATTPTLNPWEAVGMLVGAADSEREDLRETFVDPEDAQ